MSKKINRVGERRIMNCGEYATIIRYGRYNDIDVKFDSDEIAYNKSYSCFIQGCIAKPGVNRVGERRLMNCGEYATIIRYGRYSDIDVKFDSGAIVYNRAYDRFVEGVLTKPKPDRLGERRLMSCGEYAIIVRYGSYNDIDVKFDSGEIVYNKSYCNFIKGWIANPSGYRQSKVGKRHLMNCGEYATIIRYGGLLDIDIKFDSGEIAYNKCYSNFLKGRIAKPKPDRLGERRLMNCGLSATIIKYDSYNSIDVKFESDDIIKSYNCKSFDKGCCSPTWFNHRVMKFCYFDKILNDVIILMKDGSIKRKSELLGGIDDASKNR